MENLNKENFFNALQEKYPEAMAEFCNWIDEYKKEVKWNYLFMEGTTEVSKVKFHDIPIEMQLGIFVRFSIEMDAKYEGNENTFVDDINTCKEAWAGLFIDLQKHIAGALTK